MVLIAIKLPVGADDVLVNVNVGSEYLGMVSNGQIIPFPEIATFLWRAGDHQPGASDVDGSTILMLAGVDHSDRAMIYRDGGEST